MWIKIVHLVGMGTVKVDEGELGKGGLFRSLLLPLLALVVVVGALGSIWTGWLRMKEEREDLHRTLRGNAVMMERMRLPVNGRMAGNLSTAMGLPVAVVTEGQELSGGESWSDSERMLALKAVDAEGGFAVGGGVEVLAAELADGRGNLVVLHDRTWLWGWRTWGFLGLILPIGAVAAYVIARRLVRPLEQLAKAAPSFSEQALPRVLTDRSDELGILARALDGARERIINEQELRERSERLAMLGQIATGLAHEIKNPAAAILMQAELMDGGAGDLIRDEAEEIVGLVNQWLFIAQPSPPKVGMHDLASELRLMAERRGDVFSYRSVKAVVEVPELLEVECDVRRVMQAVRNLVDNAMAAMPDGGKLRLQLEEADGEACLTVFDTGDGFSETALARYGEPFYSEKEGGMGLGLVMVKRVIEAHGGRLEVENSQGGVVRMFLPVRKEVIV